MDSREEAVKLFEIFNPNGYDVNYVWDYLMVNYWKGDGTVCFSVAGNKIDGFDTETYYKKNEEQYGKIYRFKDLIAKEGIVGTFKGTPVYADSRTLRMADGTIIGEFGTGGVVSIHDLPTSEWYNPMRLTFKNGSSIEALPQKDDAVRGKNHFCTGFESPYLDLSSFLNDGISAKNGGKNSMKFTFYVTEGTRPDKKCNGTIQTMTTTVVSGLDEVSVTCDKADYNERQGVLEGIAQLYCKGRFDKEYEATIKINKRSDEVNRTCIYCGKIFDTAEERVEHEKWHVERKKARRERYLLRKRAKEIAFEEQAQKMAKEMMGEQK